MRLSWPEIRANAAAFSAYWAGKGYEKGQTQTFYDEFFAIFGVPRKQVAVYEQRVRSLDPAKTSGYIDLFWPGTLIVEQKSQGRDLTRALTQALDYYDWLPDAQRPRYMMVCDFQRFELIDLETRREWAFPLADLKRHVEAFGFILGVQPRIFRNQSPVNRKASELMGRLHTALAADGYVGHNLERLLVRLLFILFADDTGIFERKDQFLTLVEQRTSADGRDLGRWLGELFQVLDTPPDKRQRGLDADLAEFPYINGDLFRERIDMPAFDHAMRDMLLDASMFNWGEVSPAIFGSLFESVIDKVTRRKQGAHYTPEDAILKVIGPLFLDDLHAAFARAKTLKAGRERALRTLHARIGDLRFLDPACGAGNFLVVAYRELRELERELLKEVETQRVTDVSLLSKLNVDRFHGIEIDEFPAMIAQVALWMTDHIANTRLAEDFGQTYARIPLVTAPGIHHGDALEIDWNRVVPAGDCSFVFGNPPFVGAKYQSETQRAQVRRIAGLPGSGGTLDYVTAWFIKAARYSLSPREREGAPQARKGEGDPTVPTDAERPSPSPNPLLPGEGFSSPHIAFVATNSITQGEQVAQLWPLLFRAGVEIAFAHRTFVWPGRAAVHCVIVGLAPRGEEPAEKRLFSYAQAKAEPVETRHGALTAYLFDAKDADRHLVVKEESRPINGAPALVIGSKPVDGGYLIYTPNELANARLQDGCIDDFVKPYIGAEEFLNGGTRYILAVQDASPGDIRRCLSVGERLRKVRAWRLGDLPKKTSKSGADRSAESTRTLADDPSRYHVTVIPQKPYLVVPENGSESREYVPAGWLEPPIIPSSLIRVALNAQLYHFGLIISRAHMAWLNHIGGRLKSDPRYSIGLVYNTFPWPEATPAQRAAIEALAQAVLDARALPKNATSTLADLYDPDTMPPELRRAHRDLDTAIDRLYRRTPFASDRERVEHLFTLYQRLVDPLQNEGVRQNKRVARRAKAGAQPAAATNPGAGSDSDPS